MEYRFTDGKDGDFLKLCQSLDECLSECAGGENYRTEYLPFNSVKDIKDVVLAKENGIAVGCASFKHYSEGVAEIKRVFVCKSYRGKGISKQLMSLLEDRAREKGYIKLILETGKPLTAAMGLYQNIGFTVTENYGVYKGMEQSVCMEKDIK